MQQRELLHRGKAKELYATDDPGLVIIHYRDDATAFNNLKKGTIGNKGLFNNEISAILFRKLDEAGIPTHYVDTIGERDMLCRKVDIIPLEVIVRNVVAGTMAKRLGLPEGMELAEPVYEITYKDDSLGDPLINYSHAVALGAATIGELHQLQEMTEHVNRVLKQVFAEVNIRLIDFKLEYGRTPDGRLILADEISPDTCRFWDAETAERLDKDRFRRDLGNVTAAYREVDNRLKASDSTNNK